MSTTCIVSKHRNEVSETFIHAHIDLLDGPKVVLHGDYPEYTCNNRHIRYFHGSHGLRRRLAKLLPHYLYERLTKPRDLSEKAVHDYISGFLKDHNVDVILAEYGFYGAEICPHARALGIPLVVHFHGHDAHREPELAAFKERYRQLFEYAFRIVSVSHFMTDKLKKMGADASKIVYNPYGPRDYFYDIKSDYGSTLLSVGRFTDIKAPYLTLMAFKLLLEEFPDATLVMVGDGPLRETCISLAKLWRIESKISFPGALRHDQIRPLFGRACCFVQHSVSPSYKDAEGMPVAILEAGAAGLPVVSTRHAGITDAVLHAETGFLVEERDVVGMKNYLCALLKDRMLCRTLGENARKHIQTHFNIKRHIADLQELIDAARAGAKSLGE